MLFLWAPWPNLSISVFMQRLFFQHYMYTADIHQLLLWRNRQILLKNRCEQNVDKPCQPDSVVSYTLHLSTSAIAVSCQM